MNGNQIPKQLQDKLMQFQEMQQQLQSLGMQNRRLKQKIEEINHALEALEKNKKENVYEKAGSLFIEANAEEVRERLEEDKETKEARLKSFQKQESKLREKLNDMAQDLQSQFGGGGSSAPTAE